MFRTSHPIFKKGDIIFHPTFGEGIYSHWYASDASVVTFLISCADGIQKRVVLHKDIQIIE